MARNRVRTVHAGMVELDFKPQGFERGLQKLGSRPFLEMSVR